jgi:hypothetical protein
MAADPQVHHPEVIQVLQDLLPIAAADHHPFLPAHQVVVLHMVLQDHLVRLQPEDKIIDIG